MTAAAELPSKKWIVPACLFAAFVIGLALRLALLSHTYDQPGDGPFKAYVGWVWSKHPSWLTSHFWLPGHIYLNGLLMSVFKDPMVTPRVFNCLVGAVSPVVLFLWGRKAVGTLGAALGAISLVFLPLHAGLSACSLSEVPTLFFLLSALYFLSCSKDNDRISPVHLGVGVLSMFLATIFRQETWVLIPLVVLYLFALTRQLFIPAIVGLLLVIFPIYFLTISGIEVGRPLLALSGLAVKVPHYDPVPVWTALGSTGSNLLLYMGPVLFVAQLIGLVLAIRKIVRGDRNPHLILLLVAYASSLFSLMTIMLNFGKIVQCRYLITSIVWSLPFAGMGLAAIPWLRRRTESGNMRLAVVSATIVALFAVNVTFLTFMAIKPTIGITTEPWTAEFSFGDWFNKSEFRDDQVIVTADNFRCPFIPLKAAPHADQFLLVLNFWTPYYELRDLLIKRKPKLLVVGKDDGEELAYLLNVCDLTIDKEHPVFQQDQLTAYRIVDGTLRPKPDSEIKPVPCFWYVGAAPKRKPSMVVLNY